MIPYGTQDISEEDIESVVKVLRSKYLTTGPKVPEFEEALSSLSTVHHTIAVNSATSALHIACLALGLKPEDRVWTSPNSFVASANCALYCGAHIDFVDITPDTFLMDVDLLEDKLESAEKNGTLPDIVIPVHFAGLSCDMKKISKLADKFGFKIIEDAAHAVGASYQDNPVGSCKYSDITVLSFHPVKIITTGEGGAALTNNDKLANTMRQLRSHGIARDFEGKAVDEPWRYQQQLLGFNYRMTDIAAALGLSQLSRLEQFIEKRHQIADVYDTELENLPLITPQRIEHSRSALHLYPILVESDVIDRKTAYKLLHEKGVGVQIHYQPIHLQDYFQTLGFKEGDFPVCESVYSKTLSLPIFSKLTSSQQEHVIKSLREIF